MPRGMRLWPDVCGCPVSRIVSADVCSERDVLTKLNIEMCICHTKFGYAYINKVAYKGN